MSVLATTFVVRTLGGTRQRASVSVSQIVVLSVVFGILQELIRLANDGLQESDPIYEAGAVEKLGRGIMK